MTDFCPPPGFTTVRISCGASVQDGKEILQKFVAEDMEFRGISCEHHCLVTEIHPLIHDLLLIAVRNNKGVSVYKDEVIVDLSCGLSVLRGAHVFVPGVVASPPGLRQGDPVSVFVDLEKKCLKGSLKFSGSKFFIGNGIMQVSREDIFSCRSQKVSGIGVKMSAPLFFTPCLDLTILPKIFFPQNLPSVVVGHVLNPPRNSTVLDMCAAPGGKSTHLCSLMENTGTVIALDRSLAKVEKIKDNARRLGNLNCIFAYVADSRKIVSDDAIIIANRSECDFAPQYPSGSFSYILLDAPCSALGQRPRFPCKNYATAKASSYPSLQLQLLKCAVRLLSVGGVLVYSTCTTTFEENEGVVQIALEKYPCLVLEEQVPHVGNFGREQACDLDKETLRKLQYFDFLPVDRSTTHPADGDTIGFFIAKFRKIEL